MAKFVIAPERISISHGSKPLNVTLGIEKLRPVKGTLFYRKAQILVKGKKCKFVWDKSRFPRPLIVFPVHRKGDPKTMLFVQKVVTEWETNHLHRNNPNSGPRITKARADYISRLITEGHIRIPHLKQFKGHTKLILIRATIVNRAKLNPTDLAEKQAIVDFLNDKASTYFAANPGVSAGTFRTWLKEELI